MLCWCADGEHKFYAPQAKRKWKVCPKHRIDRVRAQHLVCLERREKMKAERARAERVALVRVPAKHRRVKYQCPTEPLEDFRMMVRACA